MRQGGSSSACMHAVAVESHGGGAAAATEAIEEEEEAEERSRGDISCLGRRTRFAFQMRCLFEIIFNIPRD